MKIITHNGKFHTDDVFAVATLFLTLGKENCEVIRTRDEAIFGTGDYVVDVGGIYDGGKNRFDHHQISGAGKRENGIPYASFGLVWQKFGEKLSGSLLVANNIDRTIVQSVDASDNGTDTIKTLFPDVYPYDVNNLVNLYRTTWKEEDDWDRRFIECVDWATSVLKRLIKVEGDIKEGRDIAVSAYQAAEDKRIIMVDEKYNLGRELVMGALSNFPEPVYALLYRKDLDNWQILALRKENGSYESKKALPEAWRAKSGQELNSATGISDAVFCHRSGFMCVVKSKDSAIKLAEKALNQ